MLSVIDLSRNFQLKDTGLLIFWNSPCSWCTELHYLFYAVDKTTGMTTRFTLNLSNHVSQYHLRILGHISQQQEPNSDMTSLPRNRSPVPPQAHSMSWMLRFWPQSFSHIQNWDWRAQYHLLPPPPDYSSCAELLLPVGMHLKELEASVLICCNAEQLLLLLHISFRWSAYNQ